MQFRCISWGHVTSFPRSGSWEPKVQFGIWQQSTPLSPPPPFILFTPPTQPYPFSPPPFLSLCPLIPYPSPPPSNPPLSLSPSIFYTLLLKIQLKKISLRFLWIKGNFGNCWMHLEKSLFCVHFFNFKQPILNPKSNPICEKYQNCKTGFLILTKSCDCSYVQEHLWVIKYALLWSILS